MGRVFIIGAALFLLAAFALAWSLKLRDPPADLTFVNRSDIQNIDPNRISWSEDLRLGYCLFEGLFQPDPQTLRPIPGVAQSVDISDDKTVYTFHLRDNAGWSNGDKVTAYDFLFSWKRNLQTSGDYTYLLFYIKGAREFSEAFEKSIDADFSKVGIEVLDQLTLKVTLEHPVAFFLDICAFPVTFPLNEKSMAPFKNVNAKGRVRYDTRFVQPPGLVVNGPYMIQKWDFKRRVRMVVNPNYWDKQNVQSPTVDLLIIEDNAQGEFLRYEQGTVDMLTDLDAVTAAELMELGAKDPAKARKDLHIFPAFGTYFYSFNCMPNLKDGRKNPFADKNLRKAMAMAIDREAIVKTVTRNGEIPAGRYVPDGSFPQYPRPQAIEENIAKAKALLAQAGYPDGKNFPSMELLYNSLGQHGEIAQMASRQWKNNLGIEISPRPIEGKQFGENLHNQEYAIARASWFGDYEDVSTFTDKYLSDSDNNDSRWVNQEYDDLCRAAAKEPDADKRLVMLSKAEGILLDEVPILPVYYYVNRYLFDPDKVQGLPLNPRNMPIIKAIKVRRK